MQTAFAPMSESSLMREDRQVFLGGRTGGRAGNSLKAAYSSGKPRRGLVPRAQGGGGARPPGREADRGHPQLAALSPASNNTSARTAIRPVSGRSSAGSCCSFAGTEDRFDLVSNGEPEFESWRWVDYWTPVREVIYFKRLPFTPAPWTSWRAPPSRRTRRRCRSGPRMKNIYATLARAAAKGRPRQGDQLERLTTDQDDDAEQEQGRHLVEAAIPALRALVAVVAEGEQQPVAPHVIRRSARPPASAWRASSRPA